jgi:hypothetical protein
LPAIAGRDHDRKKHPSKQRLISSPAVVDRRAPSPAFMQKLATNSDQSARALEVAILTFARTIEVQNMRWSQLDLESYDSDSKTKEVESLLFLDSAYSLRLLRAYSKIKDQAVQRHMVSLMVVADNEHK